MPALDNPLTTDVFMDSLLYKKTLKMNYVWQKFYCKNAENISERSAKKKIRLKILYCYRGTTKTKTISLGYDVNDHVYSKSVQLVQI